MTTWIVVADSSRGKIYAEDPAGKLNELYDLIHPSARLHETELLSDRPGSDHGGMGQGRHVINARTDVKEHEAEVFAHEIAQQLESGRTAGQFAKLVLIAPPQFLGTLRGQLHDEVRKLVAGEIAKDLVTHSTDEVRERLREIA